MATTWCMLVSAALAARPVALWDVVPDQLFAGRFQAGVCAFHTAGVKVEFRVGGNVVHTAAQPTLNRQSGVWEFWCPLSAADFPDGPVELAARAIPLADGHASYDLPPLTLYANSRGSLTVGQTNWVDAVKGDDGNAGTPAAPFRSLAKAVQSTPAGGTINLQPGTYSSEALDGGDNRPYWTTIQAAPGVDRDAVEVGPGRPSTQRLRWHHVTLYCDYAGNAYMTILNGENGNHLVWLDDCKAWNKQGRWAAESLTFGNRYVAYVTGGLTTEMCDGPRGAVLVRDHTIEKITSDAWSGGGKLVVNSRCHDINAGQTEAHPDFHQAYAGDGWTGDVILYNVRGLACNSQGLFGQRLCDSAFVNVLFERGDWQLLSQYDDQMQNVLFLHLTIVNQSWLWRDHFAPTNVVVANGIFRSMDMSNDDEHPELLVADNHFVDAANVMGHGITTGDPRFRDPTAHDYRLLPDSPAHESGHPLQCVPADIDGVPHPAAGRNRGCFADAPASQGAP
ncbi:MAG: DUF1565 domain-containing protein [Lentisphaerae bacterium]|nr:DUF1565 domain-containing protein [Lentisphaerota bacterium]